MSNRVAEFSVPLSLEELASNRPSPRTFAEMNERISDMFDMVSLEETYKKQNCSDKTKSEKMASHYHDFQAKFKSNMIKHGVAIDSDSMNSNGDIITTIRPPFDKITTLHAPFDADGKNPLVSVFSECQIQELKAHGWIIHEVIYFDANTKIPIGNLNGSAFRKSSINIEGSDIAENYLSKRDQINTTTTDPSEKSPMQPQGKDWWSCWNTKDKSFKDLIHLWEAGWDDFGWPPACRWCFKPVDTNYGLLPKYYITVLYLLKQYPSEYSNETKILVSVLRDKAKIFKALYHNHANTELTWNVMAIDYEKAKLLLNEMTTYT